MNGTRTVVVGAGIALGSLLGAACSPRDATPPPAAQQGQGAPGPAPVAGSTGGTGTSGTVARAPSASGTDIAAAQGIPASGPGRMNQAAHVPLGDVPGSANAIATALGDVQAPSDPARVEHGHQLFEKMNCAGCHGYSGAGGMGPDLSDGYWRFGGTPIEIYKTIYEGRSQGMPSWGRALSTDEVWDLVAYVQTLAKQPARSGQTQQKGLATGSSEGQGLGRTNKE